MIIMTSFDSAVDFCYHDFLTSESNSLRSNITTGYAHDGSSSVFTNIYCLSQNYGSLSPPELHPAK